MDRQQDEHDAEFESFLRQFQPRTPPALKANRPMMLAQLAVAAVLLLAFTLSVLLLHDRSAARNSPAAVDVGLAPQPADAARPADAVSNVQSPSTTGAPSSAPVAASPTPGAAAQSGRLQVGGAIKSPRRLFSVNAIYPEEAKAAGIQGAVVMRITIGEDGSVINVVVLRSVPLLDEAAIESVLQWQYEPTLLNGVPVEVEMNATVNFTLR